MPKESVESAAGPARATANTSAINGAVLKKSLISLLDIISGPKPTFDKRTVLETVPAQCAESLLPELLLPP